MARSAIVHFTARPHQPASHAEPGHAARDPARPFNDLSTSPRSADTFWVAPPAPVPASVAAGPRVGAALPQHAAPEAEAAAPQRGVAAVAERHAPGVAGAAAPVLPSAD